MDEGRKIELLRRLDTLKVMPRLPVQESRKPIATYPLSRMDPFRLTRHWECPVCHSTILLRSHRQRRVEFWLSPFMLPFRCDECGTRFFISRPAAGSGR